MTRNGVIPKNTRRAKEVIAKAQNILCYSLSGNFHAQPLAESPTIYGPPVGENSEPFQAGYRPLVHITQPEFLLHELFETRGTKLSQVSEHGYRLHIHSNLWYEFQSEV